MTSYNTQVLNDDAKNTLYKNELDEIVNFFIMNIIRIVIFLI